ncbi:protein of unknown function (plasmid) [Pararobbsia alpina]|uniref:hypothetical protein n=1 Tax=Pararobbsia alpina TaxID=621374 RepID=UPI0039A51A7B
MQNRKRIWAAIHLQTWSNNYAVDTGDTRNVDITEDVLDLTFSEVRALRDDDETTDALIAARSSQLNGFDGPFSVQVTFQIAAFFGVERLSDITPAIFAQARAEG